MTISRNFDDYAPPRTFNELPFVEARIEEAPDVSGAPGTWTALETITLSPVDDDPANPVLRDLTTDLATLESAWYRVVWIKASGAEDEGGARYVTPDAPSDSVFYYATPQDVRDYLHISSDDVSDEELERPLVMAHYDIDSACGGWEPWEDTGFKFATSQVDSVLTSFEANCLMLATCAQVEYRLTVGDDFMIRDQYDESAGPDYAAKGQVRKVSGQAYFHLQRAGLLRLGGYVTYKSVSSFDQFGRLPRAN